MSLESWVRRAAGLEPYELRTFGDRGRLVLARCRQAFDVPQQTARWAGHRVEQLAWNLGGAIGGLAWDTSIPLDERAEVVRLAPALLAEVCNRGEHSGAAFMFWENVVERHEIAERDKAYQSMRDATFEALRSQLLEGGKGCQLSALHGLNHLWHPATAELVDQTLPLLADDEVRDYARGAATFSNV